MCFTPTVSFVAGGAIGAIGILTLKKARTKSELPLASIPLLFAAQQLTEGVLWLSFDYPMLLAVTTYIYSLFSHVLWPFFIPLSIFLIEKNSLRKKFLSFFLVIGILVALYQLFFVITDPVTAQITNNSIQYNYHHHYPELTMILYFIAVTAGCLFSSKKILQLLGVAIGVSFFVAWWAYSATFFSVWCFFAAILSVIIYWYFWDREKTHLKQSG